MDQTTKLWTVVASVVSILLFILSWRGVLFWYQLPLEEKSLINGIFDLHFGYFLATVVIILIGIVALCFIVIRLYIFPIRKLVEETNLLHSVNINHRLTPQGGKSLKELALTINELADRYSILQHNIDKEIAQSKADIEKEKNILAAFIGELQEGVLICTAEGRIIFYNRQAKILFSEDDHEVDSDYTSEHATIRARDKQVGLGRSVFNLIDKSLIVHALDDVEDKLSRKNVCAASYFVVATQKGRLLRIETVPVLNSLRQLTGFVFSAFDITDRLKKDSSLESLIQSLIKGIRASLGGIRSSIETVLAFPEMDNEQLKKFNTIIHDESLTLTKLTEETVANYPSHIRSRWPLVPMAAKGLVKNVGIKAEDTLGISVNIDNTNNDLWIRVESYSAILVILFVLNQLKVETGNNSYVCQIDKKENFVNIDIIWPGHPVMIKTLRKWDEELLMIQQEGLSLTLKEVLSHHKASIWSYTSKENQDMSCLRIIFPACEHREPTIEKNITILTEETRPVFYDFDLFNQQGQNPVLDNRLLTELRYTVFDTETTGLAPRDGDEIISIGGVRVINGQLLQEELFDQLVDPQRPIPPLSITIHGIKPEMLLGQPTIDKVLPSFHHFCGETILVAHNAAFDMLMLQMKEEATGITFINPVLDTLLLWDVLHPAQERHNFGAIAELLGVRIVGRHTALGDALATAEVFIKMIPLLEEKGIRTLKDALIASKKSHFARLEY